jgi:DNA-binding CsgD family transcriptional regulator
MKPGARRISDTLLDLYLADGLDAQTRARCDALLSESPVDKTRLEELRVEAAVSLARHPAAAVIARFQDEREHTFTAEERARLQGLASEMRAKVHEKEPVRKGAGGKPSFLETFFLPEAIVVDPPDKEMSRTSRATELLETWFAPIERGPHGLPLVLLENLNQLISSSGGMASELLPGWERVGAGRRLKVTFRRLPEEEGHKPWALLLHEEVEEPVGPPPEWRDLLTPQEMAVVTYVLRGLDNQTIAEQLGLSINTTKTHLRHIFVKLRVDTRAALREAMSRSRSRHGEQAAERPPGSRGDKGVKNG